jgi:hypothetical protein
MASKYLDPIFNYLAASLTFLVDKETLNWQGSSSGLGDRRKAGKWDAFTIRHKKRL